MKLLLSLLILTFTMSAQTVYVYNTTNSQFKVRVDPKTFTVTELTNQTRLVGYTNYPIEKLSVFIKHLVDHKYTLTNDVVIDYTYKARTHKRYITTHDTDYIPMYDNNGIDRGPGGSAQRVQTALKAQADTRFINQMRNEARQMWNTPQPTGGGQSASGLSWESGDYQGGSYIRWSDGDWMTIK